MKSVNQYLRELQRSKKEKPQQIKDAIEIYLDLWERAIKNGVVRPDEDIETALAKIDSQGGLRRLAED